MRVLHICNNYSGSKVHYNLVKELEQKGVYQVIYCPVRNADDLGKNQFESNITEFIYSYCIKSWYKYLYHYKAWKLYKDMRTKVNLSDMDVVHAHTLFSDGILAYKAYKEYGIPYSVTIRNTDLNDFIRLMKHAYPLGRKILTHASKVIFISTGIMNTFGNSSFVLPILDQVKCKFVLQPNGIDDYWHQHISVEARMGHDILYVGVLDVNKNVVSTAKAIQKLREEKGFEDVRLVIVGGERKGDDRKNDKRVQQMIDEHPEFMVMLGSIFDKKKLSEVMRSCALFAMTSIYETFGLVYLESLSQNLPVIYTKGQGIDGMFDESVGIGVNPLNVEAIKDAIKTILLNPNRYGNSRVDFNEFKWSNIADNYLNLYEQMA